VTRDDSEFAFFVTYLRREQQHDNATSLSTGMACTRRHNKGKMEAGSFYCPSDGID
jgi:hypothetical protein